MKQACKYIVLLLITVISSAAYAQPGHIMPLANELLKEPITLSDRCANIKIIEWRDGHGHKSPISEIDQLNNYCNIVAKRYSEYMALYPNYKLYNNNNIITVSIIPKDTSFRNLNDINSRFVFRTKQYDKDGNPLQIWGYFQRSPGHIYIRNDIMIGGIPNFIFKKVFMHELFHALSYNSGAYYQHNGIKSNVDEAMARGFTRFLELGE